MLSEIFSSGSGRPIEISTRGEAYRSLGNKCVHLFYVSFIHCVHTRDVRQKLVAGVQMVLLALGISGQKLIPWTAIRNRDVRPFSQR